MDPLAGLSVACNIMQVIQFSAETLATLKQMRETASPDLYIQKDGHSLIDMTKRLKKTLDTPETTDGISSDAALLRVCNQLVGVVEALDERMRKVTPQPGASKLKLVTKSLSYQVKHKPKIKDLAQQLDTLKNTMQSEILCDLRNTLRDVQGDISPRLRDMDEDIQRFYTLVIAGHTQLEELVNRESGRIKETIKEEAQKTREGTIQRAQGIENMIKETEDKKINIAAYKQFLGSFRYTEFNERRNMIRETHPKTFEWVFKDPDSDMDEIVHRRQWDSFPEWLRAGKGIYWISGKVGAGKSTLFKFLLEHPKTRTLLNESDPKTIVISAFIWNVGDRMQRNLEGILCILLHQIFTKCKSLYSNMSGNGMELFESKHEHSDWSLPDLEMLFQSAVESSSHPFCIFVDGLDEIDRSKSGAITSLIGWLERIAVLGNIKICASSRPEGIFENRLHKFPHLRVQDLTAKDIQIYVSESLAKLDVKVGVSSNDWDSLIDDIVQKAEGVFLWVCLVVENIRTDIEDFPDWTALKQRVDQLPSELNLMYQFMWKRRNSDNNKYLAEAAFFLNNLLRQFKGIPILQFMLEWNLDVQKQVLQGGNPVSDDFLLDECSRFAAHVTSRCSGLVTSNSISRGSRVEIYAALFDDNISPETGIYLTFIHGSAIEFLLETDAGLGILRCDDISALGHQSRSLGAQFAYGLICGSMFVVHRITYHIGLPKLKMSPEYYRLWSTTFDLLVSTCCRIPEWTTPTFSTDRVGITHLNNYIAIRLLEHEFTEQFNEHISRLSQRNRLLMTKRILASLCTQDQGHLRPNLLDITAKYLEILLPEDLQSPIPLLPFGSLAVGLFSYTEHLFEEWPRDLDVGIPRRLLDSLLIKYCSNGIGLSTPRIFIPFERHERHEYNWDSTPWPSCGFRRALLRLGISHRRNNSLFVTVVKASIMQTFFSEGDLLRKHIQGFPQVSTPETEIHSPQIIMVLELVLDDDQNISNIFSKPVYSGDSVGNIRDLPEILQISARRNSNGSPKESFRKDYHEKSQSDVEEISLGDFYDNLKQPKLDVKQTVAFLVKAGYLQPEALDNADPFKVLVNEEVQFTKRVDRNNIDWSFNPHFERFSKAFLEMIQAEQDVANPKAIAPCSGGMLPKEAWNEAFERWEESTVPFSHPSVSRSLENPEGV